MKKLDTLFVAFAGLWLCLLPTYKANAQNNFKINGTVTEPTCSYSDDGEIRVHVTGGPSHYSYQWSNGETTKNISGLTNGLYTLTVTNTNTLTQKTKTFLVNKSEIAINSSSLPVSCFDMCNGTAAVTVAGGNGKPYSYLWNTGATTPDIANMCADVYTVTVSDKRGCTKSEIIQIDQPAVLTVAFDNIYPGCLANAPCNGTATAQPAGGTPPYTYSWSDGTATTIATGLCAGNYTVIITDDHNCMTQSSVAINPVPAGYNLILSVQSSGQCAPFCNGNASVIPDAGNIQDYTYQWNTGAATNIITGLCEGHYNVTVSDSNGCVQFADFDIYDMSGFIALACLTLNDESYPGANDGSCKASIMHGTGPFTFEWSDGQITETATGLTAGNYTVTVTSATLCTATSTCTVNTLQPRMAHSADNLNKEIILSPNPFSDVLNVSIISDESLTITTRDVSGRVIQIETLANHSVLMGADFKPGLYLVTVENKTGSFKKVYKILKSY